MPTFYHIYWKSSAETAQWWLVLCLNKFQQIKLERVLLTDSEELLHKDIMCR